MLDLFFKPRLTELGKIKIGGKGDARPTRDGGSFRLPQKHDHFTITTMNRDKAGDLVPDDDLMQQLAETYGSPDDHLLRQIPIRLLSNDPEDVMQSAYVWYGGKTVGARSDCKTVTWLNDRQTGRRLAEPITEEWSDAYLDLRDSKGARLFKLHTTFNCVISAREARWGGVYKFRTTSVISGRELYSTLLEVRQLTGGILIGMPLFLVVRPIQVAPEGKPTTVYVVHCELRGSEMKEIQQQALSQMQYALEFKSEMVRTQAQYRKMLVAPGEGESETEARDINEEFQPETAGADASPQPPADADPLLAQAETSTASQAKDNGREPKHETAHPTQDPAPSPAVQTELPGEPDPLADVEPPDPAAPKPPAAMIGDADKKFLIDLRSELKLSADAWTTFLGTYGVESGNDLTAADAMDAVSRLRKMRDAKNSRKPKSAAPAESGPDVAEPPTAEEREKRMAEEAAAARDKALEEVGTLEDDFTGKRAAAWADFLHGMNLKSPNYIRTATDAQAQVLLAKAREIAGK